VVTLKYPARRREETHDANSSALRVQTRHGPDAGRRPADGGGVPRQRHGPDQTQAARAAAPSENRPPTDHTFPEGERLPVADVQHRRVQFSYPDGQDCVFSDVESFEELTLSAEQIGDRRCFIKENEEYRALLLDGRLLDIVLPPNVTFEVVDTAPPSSGGSDATWKPARLDAGLEIMVPLFIAPGEKIHVDTTERKYAGRENEGKK